MTLFTKSKADLYLQHFDSPKPPKKLSWTDLLTIAFLLGIPLSMIGYYNRFAVWDIIKRKQKKMSVKELRTILYRFATRLKYLREVRSLRSQIRDTLRLLGNAPNKSYGDLVNNYLVFEDDGKINLKVLKNSIEQPIQNWKNLTNEDKAIHIGEMINIFKGFIVLTDDYESFRILNRKKNSERNIETIPEFMLYVELIKWYCDLLEIVNQELQTLVQAQLTTNQLGELTRLQGLVNNRKEKVCHAPFSSVRIIDPLDIV